MPETERIVPRSSPSMSKRRSTGTDDAGAFGARVRQLRHEAGLTLQQLSERTGLALSTISKVENNQISPSYENVVRLAEGLGIDLSELFSAHPKPMAAGRLSVTRSGTGIKHRSSNYEYEILCSELSRKRFIPLLAVLRARSVSEFPKLPVHTGEEFVHVLSGTVTLHTEHYEPLELVPGDSCYFDSRMGHALVSAGESDATVLWVCSHVEFPLAGEKRQPIMFKPRRDGSVASDGHDE
jgi:transcriptional regulator with XRE-family HTH domain